MAKVTSCPFREPPPVKPAPATTDRVRLADVVELVAVPVTLPITLPVIVPVIPPLTLSVPAMVRLPTPFKDAISVSPANHLKLTEASLIGIEFHKALALTPTA